MCLHTKLVKLQKELKVPKVQNNSFGGYKYRSCEDIVEAVKKELPDDTALILSDEMINLGDRYYIKATAKLIDKEGSIEAHGYAREALNRKGFGEDQLTGAASSYARKYALNGLLAIDDTKDSDTDENQKINHEAQEKAEKEAEKRKNVALKIQAQIKEIRKLTTSEEIADYLKSNPINGMSDEQSNAYNDLIKKHQSTLSEAV